jgi:hypothetical protein
MSSQKKCCIDVQCVHIHVCNYDFIYLWYIVHVYCCCTCIVNKVLYILSLRFLLHVSIIPFTMMPLWAYYLRTCAHATGYRVCTLYLTLSSFPSHTTLHADIISHPLENHVVFKVLATTEDYEHYERSWWLLTVLLHALVRSLLHLDNEYLLVG